MPKSDLIGAIRAGLPPGVELDEREEALLDLAARQAHDIGLAEADILAAAWYANREEILNQSHGTAWAERYD
jgi:hypothetical protein